MKINYLCPHCRNYLNVGENIVFSARSPDKKEGLLLLHPQIGDYNVIKHAAFNYKDGDKLDFFCPYCCSRLTAPQHDNLVRVLMEDEQHIEFDIIFSRVAGEKSTFKIVGENIELYGEDTGKYIDFFNLSQMT